MEATTQIIRHPVLGEVHLRKLSLARTLKIRMQYGKNIVVILPLQTTFKEAEAFLNEKIEWVLRSKEQIEAKYKGKQRRFTPDASFTTFSRTVRLLPEMRLNVRVQITDDTVFIYYPSHRPIDSEPLQAAIRKAVEHAWTVEAHEVLPSRIKQLTAQSGLSFKQLLIKRVTSYWGLCASDNTITLNIHLMHLPPHLIDYVILHELCHTKHKNHGPRFWNLLNGLTGGQAKNYAKELKDYDTRLF
ncbi:MAG: M48 family metallopeptidase [Prevotellaceae bacterium]|nr:M48 family metallopeptidase [Prevotellaceae bacterium]